MARRGAPRPTDRGRRNLGWRCSAEEPGFEYGLTRERPRVALRIAHGTGTGTGTGASRFAGRGGAASAAAATGTVTEVKGSTLYVTNASGNLVVVTLTPSTTVTRNAKSTVSAARARRHRRSARNEVVQRDRHRDVAVGHRTRGDRRIWWIRRGLGLAQSTVSGLPEVGEELRGLW